MDSVDKEYQASPTSVLVNDDAVFPSQQQSRRVESTVVSPTSTI